MIPIDGLLAEALEKQLNSKPARLAKLKAIETERNKTPGVRIMLSRKILALIYNSLEIDSDLYQAQFISAFFKLDFMNYRDANMQKFGMTITPLLTLLATLSLRYRS